MSRSRRSPLVLSEPVYRWEPGVTGQYVTYDEIHNRVIHIRPDGFSTVDIVATAGSGQTPDGISVALEQHGLRLVRFSPDGLHFVFLCETRQIGCLPTLQPGSQPIQICSKWSSKIELEVLGFFWLPAKASQQSEGSNDLAVATNQGVEVFRVFFEQKSVKSLKTYQCNVRLCWLDPISATLVVSTGPRSLQPFDLLAKNSKLPRFDLELSRGQSLEANDVGVMTLYGSAFCIHLDGSTGRVSLRNISNPLEGTPEHDIVIDVADDDVGMGQLRLSQVDNLLIVHCIEKEKSLVFDIRHKEGPIVARLCGPSIIALSGPEEEVEDVSVGSWAGWDYLCRSIIIDSSCGIVCQLQVDIGMLLQEFLIRAPHDLATLMRLLLRRTNCREHVVQVLRKALVSKARSDELAKGFAVLNAAYRQAIEAMSERNAAAGLGRQSTVSLQELEALISHQSIVSEKDMVVQVFHPQFLETEGLEPDALLQLEPEAEMDGQRSPETRAMEKWCIPLEVCDSEKGKGCQGRCPYILSAVISYLRSLLSMQILPHKILQCFVFDLCLYFRQEHTLQQLLHYHVLLDSPELVQRLHRLAKTRNCSWASQSCLDMALRVREFSTVVDMLLLARQYLDIVPFLVNQREVSFKISKLLHRLEEDETARKDDPELFDHVLTEIRLWRKEAEMLQTSPMGELQALDSTAIPNAQAAVVSPDLEGCEKWFPELFPSEKLIPVKTPE